MKMDKSSRTPGRPPSGIPRLVSRLPLPTSTANKSVRPSPSRERLRADPGLDASRLRRPSEETIFKKPLPKAASPVKTQGTTENAQANREGSRIRASFYGGKLKVNEKGMDGSAVSEEADLDAASQDVRGRTRATRPSLSERTRETLAQIPASPASVRRQSSFFNGASPMRSPSRAPSRPPSALTSYSRSPSRSSSRQLSRTDVPAQLLSAVRLPSRPRDLDALASTIAGEPSNQMTSLGKMAPPKTVKPTLRKSIGPDGLSRDRLAPKENDTIPARASIFGDMKNHDTKKPKALSPPPSLVVKKTRKPSSNFSSTLTSPSSTVSKSSSVTSATSELTPEQQAESETRKVSKSSNALRESIAKAKAAKRAASQKSSQTEPPADPWASIDTQDPFNQRPTDSNKGLLRKRVETARTTGHLNIAAMALRELPDEVMTMYDFDPNSSTEWYESVDLVKFIAADNELAELPESAFPDVDPYDFDSETDEKGSQFGGLELLDLHGNILRSLPLGIRRLQRLHTLNISNNNLTMDDLQIVSRIECLVDLKVASNNLEGPLTLSLDRLSKLETLDLHENSITELPESLAALTSLKNFNVGQNQLTSLPFEALCKLPLKEIMAPKNRLRGILIPASVHILPALQTLNVVNNELQCFSENEALALPNLQTLMLDFNRINTLPNMSSWQALLTLSADDNGLTDLPAGFTELKNIKNVDLTGNNITRLDENIGLMESLFSFRIANNPLRERKFLTMDTEDLKRDLRSRCEPESHETDEEGSVGTQFTLAPETPVTSTGWQVKSGGVLDRSHTKMTEFDTDLLEPITVQDVRCLYLQYNDLHSFPVLAISMLAQNLTDLDLSHNPMDSSELFSSPLTLPHLQSLNLSATTLTSFEPLQTYISAPSLSFLDMSYNRLTGALPTMRHYYPKLMTLLVADNQIASLSFEAVQGLQVLDVSNNHIEMLPPKLGLLGAENSSKNWAGGSALRRLEVAGNSFKVPRWQLVLKGTEAVLDWLKGRIPADELPEWEAEEVTDA
ncbi:hypothetical protein ASPZODRAFT_1955603 [Penicilliopsis zonata CBS 506.65]|uniref:Leucine-rich repeat-containing protein 40 n=1 Tax=Penicilliopsis zonata CBS 506.65 TaxID=1073090 RepID=A0A1L9SGW1_9EURO|nr:hypothetical protein ASPZODRAFT_1955603 [Penicilliopsis zonata CBS 506.65]OJJ46363.1 hypothetical protein ASPZODRAFT_1955603 [Penicilliopsis zonata CBS 506.65]